jgi:hypothetical protein
LVEGYSKILVRHGEMRGQRDMRSEVSGAGYDLEVMRPDSPLSSYLIAALPLSTLARPELRLDHDNRVPKLKEDIWLYAAAVGIRPTWPENDFGFERRRPRPVATPSRRPWFGLIQLLRENSLREIAKPSEDGSSESIL